MRPEIAVVILFGVVSLFADITYESARSVLGPLMQTLGGSIFLIGVGGGLGELISYSIRPISGYLADRFRSYWMFTFLGYIIGLFSVPLMGFCSSVNCVFLLFQVERLGKAIRNPARDHLIASVSSKYGRSFAIHELLDQIGAVIGPVLIAFLISSRGYFYALKFMVIPASLSMLFLLITKGIYSRSSEESSKDYKGEPGNADRNQGKDVFFLYILFVFFTTLGFLNFQIISFHLKVSGFSDLVIPIIFAVAMVVDSATALPFGMLFDRKPFIALLIVPLFGFIGVFSMINPVFIVFWGAYVGLTESVIRSGLARIRKGASAFGTLYLSSGLSSLLGGLIFSKLYEVGLEGIIVFSLITQISALLLLIRIYRISRPGGVLS